MTGERQARGDLEDRFSEGEKVIFIPDGKVYDFGYMGQTGKAIIYEEGERNMQDSFAVKVSDLKKAPKGKR